MVDINHQCDEPGCWCKSKKPSTLGDVLIDLSMLKARIDDVVGLMIRIERKLENEGQETKATTTHGSNDHGGSVQKSGRRNRTKKEKRGY